MENRKSLFLCVSVCLSLSLSLSFYLSVSVSLSVCLSVSPPTLPSLLPFLSSITPSYLLFHPHRIGGWWPEAIFLVKELCVVFSLLLYPFRHPHSPGFS